MTTRMIPARRPYSDAPEEPTRDGAGLAVARALSVMILLLMVVASLGGLGISSLYQDAAPVEAMLRGYDLVTLAIAAPALAVALLPSLRGSRRAQLLWAGVLGYAAYNYAIYVFGSAFNDFFLIHVALFSLSVFAFALALANLDVDGIGRDFSERTPARSVSVLLLLLSISLGGMWIFYSLRYAFTGESPGESLLVLPAASVHLGYVLDLALLIPGYALAGVLLWRKNPWGYVLATLMLVSGTISQLGYMTALAFQAYAKVPGATWFDPVEPLIAGGFTVGAVLMLASVRQSSRSRRADGEGVERCRR